MVINVLYVFGNVYMLVGIEETKAQDQAEQSLCWKDSRPSGVGLNSHVVLSQFGHKELMG